MEGQRGSGFLCIVIRLSGSEHDPAIGVKYSDPNHHEKDPISNVPLSDQEKVGKQALPETEYGGEEEARWLRGDDYEQIRQSQKSCYGPQQCHSSQRPARCTDLGVAEWSVDGDVALCRHAGQAQWGVLGGEDGQQDQDAAQGGMDPVDGVAGDKQDHGHRHLNHVVDHQVDEEDVARVGVEELEGGKRNGKRGSSLNLLGSPVSVNRHSCVHYLVLAEGVNGTPVDASDGDPQKQHNDILGYSFGQRLSILCNHRHVCR